MNIANVTSRFALLSGLDNSEIYKWRTLIDDACDYVKAITVKDNLRESKRRFKLITEVKLKLTESGTYGGSIKNENPECRSIERVRYVNATSDKTTIQTADNIISKSNSDSYSIALECVGCLIESIGRSAVLNDDMFGEIENLTVRKIRYTVGSDGEKTTVTLGKERF